MGPQRCGRTKTREARLSDKNGRRTRQECHFALPSTSLFSKTDHTKLRDVLRAAISSTQVRPVVIEDVQDLATASAADSEASLGCTTTRLETCGGEKPEEHRLNPYYGPGNISRGIVPLEAQVTTWEPPEPQERTRSLRVALIGPPNAGKSSLLNALLSRTLSAVSPKVNTTRGEIRGILTEGDTQLVFLDAPGIIESHRRKKFCRDLVSAAWRGYEDADVGLLVVDAVKRPTQEVFNVVKAIAPKPSLCRRALGIEDSASAGAMGATRHHSQEDSLSPLERRRAGLPGTFLKRHGTFDDEFSEKEDGRIPIILCLNKVDLASHPKWIYARAREFESHGHFERIFHLSAKNQRGLQPLLDHLFATARPGVWVYPAAMKTTLPKVQQVAELIKTYIFCWFNKDVPYRIEQKTIGWTPRLDGSLVVEQELLVKDAKVARMICGVRNRLLFQMRRNVSYKLQQNWGQKVLLYIHVKALKQSPS
ncbi:gtpase [Cystoisospora suis]|uniref:Gtpase n=1 Tax=Cystoisospora suis TaxID=483139 RepID=A0A2C6KPF3_9APIC|nr:gtpase [Cystoisospora suis]